MSRRCLVLLFEWFYCHKNPLLHFITAPSDWICAIILGMWLINDLSCSKWWSGWSNSSYLLHTAPGSVQIQRWPLQPSTAPTLCAETTIFSVCVDKLQKMWIMNAIQNAVWSYKAAFSAPGGVRTDLSSTNNTNETHRINYAPRSERQDAASRFSSCHWKRLFTLRVNLPLSTTVRLNHLRRINRMMKCKARHRRARIGSCRLLSLLKGQSGALCVRRGERGRVPRSPSAQHSV